jgi:hypothetical protein
MKKKLVKSITIENSLNKDILKFYIPFSKTKIKNIDRNTTEESSNNNKKSTTGFSNSTTFIMEVLEIDTILFTIIDNTNNTNNEIENNTFNYLNKKLNNNKIMTNLIKYIYIY